MPHIVYKDASGSIAELKKKIEDDIREIDTIMYRAVILNLLKRAFSCLVTWGGHFEHLLQFKFFFLLKYTLSLHCFIISICFFLVPSEVTLETL